MTDKLCRDHSHPQGHRYRVKLQGNSSLQLTVHFQAFEIRTISMPLPARVFCGLTCPPCHLSRALILSAKSIETRLTASTSHLSFGPCIVPASSNTPHPPIAKCLTITNQQCRPMAWSFGSICWDDPHHHQDVFMVEQRGGLLQPNACCKVMVRLSAFVTSSI